MEEVTGKTPGKISGSRAGVPAVRSVVSGRVLPLSGDAGGTSGGRAAGRKPCPVCGSLEHPAPCRLETEPIREEQVEALRAGRDDADQKQRTAAEACQEAQISLEHESRRRIEIQGKLYGQNQDSPAAQPDVDALDKELRQMAQEIRRCRQAETTYTDRIAMEETIRQKREANGAGQKKLEAALELKRSEVQQAAIESQMRRNELEELSKRLEWKDSRTLRGELEKRSRELEALAEAVTAADKKVQECREKCRELEGSLSSLREHMEADSETDPEEKSSRRSGTGKRKKRAGRGFIGNICRCGRATRMHMRHFGCICRNGSSLTGKTADQRALPDGGRKTERRGADRFPDVCTAPVFPPDDTGS